MAKNSKNKIGQPDIRFLRDMRDVIYDQKWLKSAGNFPVYYMYRGIERKGHLRHDITKFNSKMFGEEFPKTVGHNHPVKFTELYTVLRGEAIFLVQKSKGKVVKDVWAVKAKKNESVIIPGGSAHITINPKRKRLICENWQDDRGVFLYDYIKKMKGACYYYTKSGWIKNNNYKKIPKLRFEKPLKKIHEKLKFF
jgi:glucose-6-phosphate isomerase